MYRKIFCLKKSRRLISIMGIARKCLQTVQNNKSIHVLKSVKNRIVWFWKEFPFIFFFFFVGGKKSVCAKLEMYAAPKEFGNILLPKFEFMYGQGRESREMAIMHKGPFFLMDRRQMHSTALAFPCPFQFFEE